MYTDDLLPSSKVSSEKNTQFTVNKRNSHMTSRTVDGRRTDRQTALPIAGHFHDVTSTYQY